MNEYKSISPKNIVLISIAAILVIIAVMFNPIVFIGQNEGVVIRNTYTGKISEKKTPGMTVIAPIVNSIEKYSRHQESFKTKLDGNTKDNVQITFNLRVVTTVEDGMKVYKMLNSTEKRVIEERVESLLSKVVDRVVNRYGYSELRSSIARASDEMTTDLSNYINKEFPGIKVNNVIIDNVDAPDEIEKAINQKISKKQAADASAYEKQKAQNEADAQKIKKSVGKDQQKIEICAKHPQSYACLPDGVKVIGGNALVDTK